MINICNQEWISIVQTTILLLTGLIIYRYTAETRRIRLVYEQQLGLISNQRFEQKFFNLLSALNHIMSAITLTEYENGIRYTLKGHEVTQKIYLLMKREIKETDDISKGNYTEENILKLRSLTKTNYERFCINYQNYLGHFYRHIYHIFLYLQENEKEMNFDTLYFYGKLVRAQLSFSELALLLYNGISKYGIDFYDLMEKYELLKVLEEENLIAPFHKYYYPHLRKAIDEKKQNKIIWIL